MKGYLFISGCGRSGTSALAQLIGSHKRIILGMERYGHLVNNNNFSLTKSHFTKERFLNINENDTFYNDFDEFHKWDPNIKNKFVEGYDYIGDKRPELYLAIEKLNKIFNYPKHIYIYRNIYDVAMSWEHRANVEKSWPEQRNYKMAVSNWNESLKIALDAVKKYKNFACVKYENLYIKHHYPEEMFNFLNLRIDNSVKTMWESQIKQFNRIMEQRNSKNKLIVSNADENIYKYIDDNACFYEAEELDKYTII